MWEVIEHNLKLAPELRLKEDSNFVHLTKGEDLVASFYKNVPPDVILRAVEEYCVGMLKT